MKKMPRVAIIGSRQWEDKRKIKDLIWQLKQKFGNELTIVSGGCKQGADKYARKYAIELGCDYVEFNPAFEPRNLYSAMPSIYHEKPYHVSCFFHRNDLMAKYADYCIALIPKNATEAHGTEYTIKRFKKLNKNVVIIE